MSRAVLGETSARSVNTHKSKQEPKGDVKMDCKTIKFTSGVAVCSALLESIGAEEMMRIVKKHGKKFMDQLAMPKITKNELRERDEMCFQSPYGVQMFGKFCGKPGCPAGVGLDSAGRPQPSPGWIGVTSNQVAIHTNSTPGQILETRDQCVLKLGKSEKDGTQSITLQYEAQPAEKKNVCTINNIAQVTEADFKDNAGKGKGKGKSKGNGKKVKGKKK